MKIKNFARRLLFSLVFSLCSWPVAYGADAMSFNPTSAQISAQSGGGVPVGTIVAWPVATNPADAASWLECNGHSTTGYPELAAVIGGKTPDLRGKFLRGLGGSSAALGVIQGDAMRNMTGIFHIAVNGGQLTSTGVFREKFWSGGHTGWSTTEGREVDFDASRQVPTAGENRPVNMAVRYLIRARP